MTLGCEISNECGYVKFHRQSLKGSVIDLIIHFHEDETVIEYILDKTSDLFLHIDEQLNTVLCIKLETFAVLTTNTIP